jgi:choline dehydrogenase-like flavoprotein
LFDKVDKHKPEISAIHMFGSCPLGNDAARFPLDPHGQVAGTGNLFVNDTSMLPTSIGVNPQATVMAMAMRNIEHFMQNNPRHPAV